MSNGAGNFSPFPKMHLYFYSRCNGNDMGKIYVEIQGGHVTPLPLPGGAHGEGASFLHCVETRFGYLQQ